MKNISVTTTNYKVGDKVVRGRDWRFYTQDEDSEFGEIIDSHNENGWVYVQWQSGYSNAYCLNAKDELHLYFYTKKLTDDVINRIGHLLIEK